MKKMLTVVAGVLVAGSLMSSVARADVMVGQDKSTWSPYPVEVTAKDNVKLGGDESSKSANSVEGEKVGLPNPWSDVKDLKEAEKKTGIKLTAPKKIKGFDEISYQVLLKKDKIVQIDYRKDDNNSVAIRKGISKKDISGDYNEYKNTKKVTVKGNKIKLQGNGKTYSLATWTKGKYSFSVGIYNDGKGMSLKEIKNIIGQVK
ncbi:MAG: hypothetical protein HXK79_08635 [Lachnospiraceae bacterium]|nr:hypothetical protein [Lachnospiraceae bacterium]